MDGYTSGKEIRKIAEQLPDYDYSYVGIRIQDGRYGMSVGEPAEHESNVWDDGNNTGEGIRGVCAVDAHQAAKHTPDIGYYKGRVAVILGSAYSEVGNDDCEIIMRSIDCYAVVLDIIEL